MSGFSIEFLDLVVVAIIIASAAFAVYRGFVSETLSIFSWAAAAFATLYFGPAAATVFRGMFSPFVAFALGYAGIFLLVLVPLSYISHRMAQNVSRSAISALDRSLGAAFGVIRGLAVVGFAYLIFSMAVPIPRQPEWVTDAHLLPLIQSSADVLVSLVPDQRQSTAIAETETDDPVGVATAPVPRANPDRHVKTASSEAPAVKADADRKPSVPPKKTYGASDRQALDKLIEATGNGGTGEP